MSNLLLGWSDDRPPCDEIPYSHRIAATPFGRFVLTWRSWKIDPVDMGFVFEETPWGVCGWREGWDSEEEAMKAAEEELVRRSRIAMSSMSEKFIEMQKIGELIETQDNRATSEPIFIVEERRRLYGVDTDYTDDTVWIHVAGDHEEADENESERLDRLAGDGEPDDDWTLVGYVDRWEFVTACFTEKACEDYIAANKHNLTDPRIYAATGYRNHEFIAVREFLETLHTQEKS